MHFAIFSNNANKYPEFITNCEIRTAQDKIRHCTTWWSRITGNIQQQRRASNKNPAGHASINLNYTYILTNLNNKAKELKKKNPETSKHNQK